MWWKTTSTWCICTARHGSWTSVAVPWPLFAREATGNGVYIFRYRRPSWSDASHRILLEPGQVPLSASTPLSATRCSLGARQVDHGAKRMSKDLRLPQSIMELELVCQQMPRFGPQSNSRRPANRCSTKRTTLTNTEANRIAGAEALCQNT